jgi:phosphoribosylglycinamide formyltransferase-1
VLDQLRIAVLVSGSGSNLQALLDAQQSGLLHSGRITLVVSDNPGAYSLERAKAAGVQTLALDRRATGVVQVEKRILEALKQERTDLIVLAGFLMILSPDFVMHFEGRIINVHPSLLPAFGGKGYYGIKVHQAALARGVKLSGATVHLVNAEPDGGPILMQKAVRILKKDTAETLQQRIMRQAEWRILPRATQMMCQQLLKEAHHADHTP